ncbi:hypothetical protein D770_27075 [Flammeovirgaceae bacterium 311]|nr:hypothetical protein D770_27075 [Flammeovirgaceae bacterium 311]
MTPSAIVLNVCASVFLTLALIFFSYLLNRYRSVRRQHVKIPEEAKQIPLYERETSPVLQRSAKLHLAKAE